MTTVADDKTIHDGIHAGAQVTPEPGKYVLIGRPGGSQERRPWHQGRWPMERVDTYAEFVHKEETDEWSVFTERAFRVPVTLTMEQWNERRSNDWKGYDEIEGRVETRISLNNIPCYVVRGWASDLMRHLVEVGRIVDSLLTHPAFGWWTPEEISGLVGRSVYYGSRPATVQPFGHVLGEGCIILHVPGYSKVDGYYDDDILKVNILDPSFRIWSPE